MYRIEKQTFTFNGFEWLYMNSFDSFSEASEEMDRLQRVYKNVKFRITEN